MKIFRIQPDDKNWGKLFNDDIETRRLWYMPGINHCSGCGKTWSATGISYPLVDLSAHMASTNLFKPGTVTVNQYLSLRSLVEKQLSGGLPIPPGTEFGPLLGTGKGKCGDFAWPQTWILLVQSYVYKALESKGLFLPGISVPQLKLQDFSCADLREPQIVPQVSLSPLSYDESNPRICPLCGRDERKVERIVIDHKTVPLQMDIFRIINFWTYILVTEKFKDAVTELRLTNITFEEIDVC